jgi:hypothetical protein
MPSVEGLLYYLVGFRRVITRGLFSLLIIFGWVYTHTSVEEGSG